MPSLADIPIPSPVVAETPAPALPATSSEVALPTPFDAISAGKLPGLQVPPVEKGALDPIQEFVVSNLHALQANGIEYVDLPNDTTVLYNPEIVTTDAIHQAFKDGTLDKLVPTAQAFQEFAAGQAAGPQAVADVAPTPVVAGSGASIEGSTPPGVNRARLANVVPPGPGIKPNPIPTQLSRRAL